MHMADALISPAVGGTMWAVTAGLTIYSAKQLKEHIDDGRAPLMGVLGAFIFAAQMINFTIPGTGSSGHLGGGLLLAILLGPHAAFLCMASILTVQALFFADGGLLALGCNIFNLGFFPCFIAYPLLYRQIVRTRPTPGNIVVGSLTAAIVGLQLGALAVVLETFYSGISDLPLGGFLLLMQPIHLAIGVIEGLVTAAVVTFVWKARPETMESTGASFPAPPLATRKVLAGFLVVTVLTAGLLSWFASTNPDGLEWSILRVSGKEELEGPQKGVHPLLAALQEKIALFPAYDLRKPIPDETAPADEGNTQGNAAGEGSWPAVSSGTSLAGLVGGLMTLIIAGLIGLALRRYQGLKR